MQVWSSGFNEVGMLQPAFPLLFLGAGFSGAHGGDGLALFDQNTYITNVLHTFKIKRK